MSEKRYATEFKVIEISLYSISNESKPYVNLAGDMCKQFQYYEDIFWPSYAATMVIEDSAENIISTMPIQGFEKVVVEVDDQTETSGHSAQDLAIVLHIAIQFRIISEVSRDTDKIPTQHFINIERRDDTICWGQVTGKREISKNEDSA